MAIWTKIITLFRGAAHEAGTAVVDANAMRILDQEVRDAQNALLRSRDDLAKIMAQRKIANDKLNDKKAKQVEYSNYIREALARDNRALAQDVATKLATIEASQSPGRWMRRIIPAPRSKYPPNQSIAMYQPSGSTTTGSQPM